MSHNSAEVHRTFHFKILYQKIRFVSSVGRALHRYRRGHRFKSRTGLNFFFRPYFHNCSSNAHYCEDHFHSRLYPQCKYMTFIYSQPFIHHFTGSFGTKIMTRTQLACQLSWQSAAHYLEDHFHSKFVWKIESNAQGILRTLQYKTNREALTVLSSVIKHAGSGQSTKEVQGETGDVVECFSPLLERHLSSFLFIS